MSTQAHEIQGSASWLEWRRTRGGASEVAALMGCSPWFPRTPYELWMLKTGRASDPFEHNAMARGKHLEDAARMYIEGRLGDTLEPQVMEYKENPRIIASLDGFTFDGQDIAEIKIPWAGKESDLWKHIEKTGAPPDYYIPQVQQGLMVSGATFAWFAVCLAEGADWSVEIDDAYMICVLPDESMHAEIRGLWESFFNYLDTDTPPPLTDKDIRQRSDPEWRDAAEAYRMAKRSLENAQSAEKLARERLQELAGDYSAEGCGVKVTKFWRAGSVDYKKAIPDDVDIEQYRKQGNWNWRITEAKE